MPQICDMGQAALLPLRRKACCGFFRPKNPTASAGFEPAILGTYLLTYLLTKLLINLLTNLLITYLLTLPLRTLPNLIKGIALPFTHFCWRLSHPGQSAAGRIMPMKNSNSTIGNRPATLRFVAQCLNQQLTPHPLLAPTSRKISYIYTPLWAFRSVTWYLHL
jgi:hypothetical protein